MDRIIGPGKSEIDVVIQDSTSPIFHYFFMDELKDDIVLTAPVAIGDEVVNVSAGHGFTGAAGEYILLAENNRFLQLQVTGVAGNAIDIEEPSTVEYTIAAAAVVRGNVDMNVKGDVTPVEFISSLRNFTAPVDISSVIMTMQHAGAPDDSKFGGIAALAKGVFFTKVDGSTFSLGNYRANQDFIDRGGVVTYTDKGPAGINATNMVFDLKKIFGQVIRLDPSINDALKGLVRDDISAAAGIAKFTASLIGSYTVGE